MTCGTFAAAVTKTKPNVSQSKHWMSINQGTKHITLNTVQQNIRLNLANNTVEMASEHKIITQYLCIL